MKQSVIFLTLVLILAAAFPAAADFYLNASDYASAADAVAAIPEDAGSVTFYFDSLCAWKDSLTIPRNRGIASLRMIPAEGVKTASVPALIRIFADGIPLSIGAGMVMNETSVYGGTYSSAGCTVTVSTSVTCAGAVGYIFGGSLSEDGGCAEVQNAAVVIEPGGTVFYEVFGGGHAAGEGSVSNVGTSSVSHAGSADYVLGGGFAEYGGSVSVTQTHVSVTESGSVEVALFAGGSAVDEGSLAAVENSLAVLDGTANWAFPGDFAFGAGETRTEKAGRLEISATGHAGSAFIGSFASDENTYAVIDTAELMNCGTADSVISRSLSADGGRAETLHVANFACREGEQAATEDTLRTLP